MLEVKKVSKIYRTDEVEQKALDEVSICFRRSEFVSILGPSGSGKTTLLNIIGGLDRYTSGDLVIDGVSTKEYTGLDWDTYRNHRIGFVFQSYNLISHQTILANVELALTLSGVSKSDRVKRAKEALRKVGLGSHMSKRPAQLSGGQMQRVAIARALVNNPDIILADEPTGALDSKTSVQIMDLLKEVAKEKLVIMVTHNPDLAKEYSTRIIKVKDGKIVADSKPYDGTNAEKTGDNHRHSSMSLLTALSLSKNNLMTKRGRTLLTAIAGSIGIIGIALILALARGVNNYAGQLSTSGSNASAITVRDEYIDSEEQSAATLSELDSLGSKKEAHDGKIVAKDDLSKSSFVTSKQLVRHNDTQALKSYIESNSDKLKNSIETITYDYGIELQVFDKDKNDKVFRVNPVEEDTTTKTSSSSDSIDSILGGGVTQVSINQYIKSSFAELVNDKPYEILAGEYPKSDNELLLVTDTNGELNLSTMYALNIQDRTKLQEFEAAVSRGDKIEKADIGYKYDEIVGKTYKLIVAADYYQEHNGAWVDMSSNNDYISGLYNNGVELKISGVAKVKKDGDNSGFLGYTHGLVELVANKARDTKIAKQQISNTGTNVITGAAFVGDENAEKVLRTLNAPSLDKPTIIGFYAKDDGKKADVKKFLDDYNNQAGDKKVYYVDATEALVKGIQQIVNMLSYVLIAFVAISLIVSSIMIGIITYISVLERTKEIGILRAIGASKRDVKRVFRAETVIEGFAAGAIGVVVAWLLCLGINGLVSVTAHVDNITDFSIIHAIVLILISIGLTVFAGAMPANSASKKDPVEALRTE